MISIKKAEQLHGWGLYENTELGNVWRTISNLYIEGRDYISSNLIETLSDELEIQHKLAKKMIKNGEIDLS